MYSLFYNITPPFIFKIIKKSHLYFIFKNILHWGTRNDSPPTINLIKAGLLKDYKFFLRSDEAWQAEMINGQYDDFLFDYIAKLNLKDSLVLDIGAHIGYHSIYFSKIVGENGLVYAFEPNPFNIKRIKMNIKANEQIKNIRVKELAIADRDGEEIFVFSDKIENGASSGGFLETSDPLWDKDVYVKEAGFEKTKVKTITLDSLIDGNENKKISLLKIDVEGGENLVLKGGRKFIELFRPIIVLEVHSIYNMFEVLTILKELNYDCRLLKKESDGRCFIASQPKE